MVAAPSYHRDAVTAKLTPYHARLELALKADALRIKQNRRTPDGSILGRRQQMGPL